MTKLKLKDPTPEYFVLIKDTPEYRAGAIFKSNTSESFFDLGERIRYHIQNAKEVCKGTGKNTDYTWYELDIMVQKEWFSPVTIKYEPLNEKKS